MLAETPAVASSSFAGVVVADDVYLSFNAMLGGPIEYSPNQVHIVVVFRLDRTEDDVSRENFACNGFKKADVLAKDHRVQTVASAFELDWNVLVEEDF